MRAERTYQLDDNDNVIGEFIPIEEYPIYRAIQKIKQTDEYKAEFSKKIFGGK